MGTQNTTSILTDSQRKYLKGEKNPSNPREYDRRIRERITAAMGDFAILFSHLDDKELQKAFGTDFAESITTVEEVQHGAPEGSKAFGNSIFAFAFLARALNRSNERVFPMLAESDKTQPALRHFSEFAELGLGAYLREYHRQDVIVSLNTEIEEVDDFFPEEG